MMADRPKILIVDDRQENLTLLRRFLRDVDAEIIEAASGDAALLATLDHQFAVAILDVVMPVMDGYELAACLRGNERTKAIPIVFLTGVNIDEPLIFQGYEAGAVDYLVKPFAPEILRGKVKVFLEMDRNQRELQRNLESYRTLIEQSPVAIQVMTPDGRIAQINDAYKKLWGVTSNDLGEYNILQDQQVRNLGLMPHIERAFAGENVRLPPSEYCRKSSEQGRHDAKCWIRAHLYCVKNERGELLNVVMMQTDISEHKQMEARLERERRQRDQEIANRIAAEAANQAKSAFLANMSHELRTPLNAIIGFSEMLLERADRHPLDEQQRDRLTRIEAAGHRLLSLVNDVLDIAKVESGKVEPKTSLFSLETVAREVSGLAETLVSKSPSVAYRLDLAPGLPQIVSDQHKICQILINLVDNAVKFTEQGIVTVRIRQHDNALLMSVADTGVGIAEEHFERLFDKFYQVKQLTHRSVKGTGLGLAVCKAFADLLGGEITVQSVVGQGSVFTLALPDGFDNHLQSTTGHFAKSTDAPHTRSTQEKR